MREIFIFPALINYHEFNKWLVALEGKQTKIKTNPAIAPRPQALSTSFCEMAGKLLLARWHQGLLIDSKYFFVRRRCTIVKINSKNMCASR